MRKYITKKESRQRITTYVDNANIFAYQIYYRKKGKIMTTNKNANQENIQLQNSPTSEPKQSGHSLLLSHEVSTPTITDDKNVSLEEIIKERVSVGMVIKNYKQLCQLLDLPILSGGNAKQAQIKNLKCYMDFEKSGQKFIITDIFDTPLTINDQRKLGNNSIYVKYIEVILLQYLSKQNGFTSTLNKVDWWRLLGFINEKYKNTPDKELETLDSSITPFEIKMFYQRCNTKLERILFSALNNLKNRKLIIYELQTVITYKNINGEIKSFVADDDEKKKILEIERYVLKKELKLENMFQVYWSNKQATYYKRVQELLEYYYKWSGYYKQIKIIYVKKDVIEELSDIELRFQQTQLNGKIVDALNTNSINSYNKKMIEFNNNEENYKNQIWGETNSVVQNENQTWKYPPTFIKSQNILTEELVRIGHENIVFNSDDFIKSNFEENITPSFDKW
jgi:hypothetical protein